MSTFRIIHADVMDGLADLPDASFRACFCDPPYGLSFMGKAWDHGVPGAEVWREVLRVLKPGSPLLAFGGTRTYHRLACAIEDAGFAIADTLCWLYGSGFPKGHAQLKPAWEPITLAWKKGKRVLAIDAGRIEANDPLVRVSISRTDNTAYGQGLGCGTQVEPLGRWPANVLLDEDAAAALDAQSGHLSSGFMAAGTSRNNRMGYNGAMPLNTAAADTYGDSGGASRFFYIAKADSAERNASGPCTHPTVKPVDLCAYLAKLILFGDGARLIVPFSGSGSEIMGAMRAGWAECVGIEKEAEYVELSRRRILGDAPMFNAGL